MTLPARFILRTLIHHIHVAGCAVLLRRGNPERFESAVTLVTFHHGDTVNGVEPLLLQIRCCFPVAVGTGRQHLLFTELGMGYFFRLPGNGRH